MALRRKTRDRPRGRAMTDQHSILQRKLALAGSGDPADDGTRSIGPALARALREGSGMLAEVDEVSRGEYSLAELIELVDDHVLLHLVEVEHGALGVVWMDPVLRAAVIELQTLGRIGRGEVAARRPTRLDATLAQGFAATAAGALGRALGRADLVLSSFLDDLRPLALILEDGRFDLLSLSLTLGEGDTRKGRFWIALPQGAAVPAAAAARAAPCGPATAPDWSGRIQRVVLDASAELEAVLGRITLPLAELLALREGVVLTLPRAALDAIDLVDGTGARLARGRLGQTRGHRALRLATLAGGDRSLAPDETGPGGALTAPPGPDDAAAPAGGATGAGLALQGRAPGMTGAASRPALPEAAPA